MHSCLLTAELMHTVQTYYTVYVCRLYLCTVSVYCIRVLYMYNCLLTLALNHIICCDTVDL